MFNFKKIAAIGASALMIGMTAGVATAANYPAPFVVGGSADVAVVYGTGSGVSILDAIEAGNLQSNLQSFMGGSGGGTTTTTSGEGDSYKFEKTSTKFNLGDGYTDVISSSLDSDELPTLLVDGKYIDDDNNEFDFTQKITMENNLLTMFEDNDYKEDEPSIGFRISSGTLVLTYLLTMSDQPLLTNLPTSDLTFMGKTYYVLSQTATSNGVQLILLDSATDSILSEGETVNVDGRTVFIEFIGSDQVKLNVDGEITNSLAAGQTYKLSDETYIGIKEVLFTSKESSVSKVEFSIGSGKLKLSTGADIQMNDDTISGLAVTIINSTTLESIEITWSAEDDLFITEDSSALMPGFEAVKLSFGGLSYPAEEAIAIQQGGDLYITLENFPLRDGAADINLIYGVSADSTFNGLGKDVDNELVTAASGANLTYDRDTDDYFIASWSDGSDAESYLMRFTNFVTESSVDKADLQYYKNGAWVDKKTSTKNLDTISIGSVDLRIWDVNNTANNVIVESNNANTNFYTLYSKEGLTLYLPWVNSTAATASTGVYTSDNLACTTGRDYTVGELYTGILTYNDTSTSTTTTTGCPTFVLKTVEEDKNENKGSSGTPGDTINVTLGWDGSTSPEAEVSSIATTNTDATSTEILDTDVERDFTYSALATEILFNKPSGSAQNSVTLMYHGSEVSASVFITSPDVSLSTSVSSVGGASQLGDVLVKDTEISSVSSKNLIVVGGSCINSVAAKVLGAGCGADFTAKTTVGSGQFLIKSVGDVYTSGKIALVVAGYEVSDTVNAAKYLRTQAVDTTAGKTYIGTTSTSATLMVE